MPEKKLKTSARKTAVHKSSTAKATANARAAADTETYRILAKDCLISNDTSWRTHNNGMDCIVGPSGAGKTTGYVIPNILNANGSIVVADTKGNLVHKLGPYLRRMNYRVELIDFKVMYSSIRYNPMEYISIDEKTGEYSTKDILKVARVLVPDLETEDVFWNESARHYVSMLISYVLNFRPEEQHSLRTVMEVYRLMESDDFYVTMAEICEEYPDSYVAQVYQEISRDKQADRTYRCIMIFVDTALTKLSYEDVFAIYENPNRFDFRDLGREKTALFLNVSDVDRSQDELVSLFWTQAFQALIDFSDHECPGERLPMPVRFIMDDFATNTRIENFSDIVSVIRSRNIYVSIILQSLDQLYAIYGEYKTNILIDNFDNLLYLGGHNASTVHYIAQRANVPANRIMDMSLDSAWVFINGQPAKQVTKYDLRENEHYKEISEVEDKEIDSLPVMEDSAKEV